MSYFTEIARSVKRFETEDKPALRAFQLECFGPTFRQVDDAFCEWLFDRNPQFDPERPPFWVCRRDDVVVGQQAAIPVVLKVGETEQRAAWMIDWMIHPAWRLKGVAPALLAANMADHDLMLGLGVEDAPHKMMVRAGWNDVGRLSLFVRPLDARACARLLKVPEPLAKVAPDFVFGGTARAAGLGARLLKRLTLEPVGAFDEQIDAIWRGAKDDYRVLIKRDAATVRWRYDDGPLAPLYQRYYFKRRGVVVGYAVTRTADWRGHIIGRVVDYLIPKRYASALFALLIEALHCKRAIAVFFEQWHPGAAARLHALGCVRARMSHRFMFRLRDPASPLGHVLKDAGAWFLTPGDSDFDHVLIGTETQAAAEQRR